MLYDSDKFLTKRDSGSGLFYFVKQLDEILSAFGSIIEMALSVRPCAVLDLFTLLRVLGGVYFQSNGIREVEPVNFGLLTYC